MTCDPRFIFVSVIAMYDPFYYPRLTCFFIPVAVHEQDAQETRRPKTSPRPVGQCRLPLALALLLW